VISDAGIARVIDLNLARRPGRVPAGYGTAQYLAPEQARGGRVDAAADVWGIGATLFAAATAKRPFNGSGAEQLERRAQPVRRLRRGLSKPFADVVDACLEPEPADRPALAELEAELDALL
jgi:eukaryotic-like serine/threonine-protein kinase